MVLVFSGLLQVIKDFGISNALIYKKDITDEDLDTAFWAQVVLGITLTLVLMLSRKHISSFYDEPNIEIIIFYISFVFTIDSLSYVHSAFLRKKMLFKRIVIVESISVISSSFIALIFALSSLGIWSLIAKIISLSIIQTILFWLVVKWKPSIRFSRYIFYEQIRYGLPLVGNQLTAHFMRNADNILIGKFIGADALGIYNRAYSLMMMPINQLVSIYGGVMFPSLCLVSDENEVFKNNWIKITRISTFLILPTTSLIFLLSDDFVHIVLGDKWAGVIPILKNLSFAAAVQAICTVGYVFNAKGKTKELFSMNLVINSLLVVSIVLGIPYGIESVALFYTVASIIFIPLPVWFFTTRLVGCSLYEVLDGIAKIVIVNGFLLSTFITLNDNINFHPLVNLFVVPVAYIITYFLFLFFINEHIYKELYRFIKNKK